MIWFVSSIAVVTLVFAGVVWRGFRRKARRRASVEQQAVDDLGMEGGEARVMQFRTTGTHRLALPRATVSTLRQDIQAMLEDADIEADLETLDAYLTDVRDAVGADEAVFWRWSEAQDRLTPGAWSTHGATRPSFFDMQAWGGLVKWAAEARVIHFDADARVAVTRLAAAPVEHEGRLLGVLSVARAEGLERGREFLKAWLPRYAGQVGRLVSLFEVRREYGRYMRQSHALLSAAQRVQGHKSQEALCRTICETALQVSSATEAALIRWRADESRGWVHFATPGFNAKAQPPFPLSDEALGVRACTSGTTLLIGEADIMTGRQSVFVEGDNAWPRGTIGFVPLKLEERVIGSIVIASPTSDSIPREEAHNVALLGALAASSLEMVWEIEEVSRRARTDALTGLPNRRAFNEQLETLLAQADRFGHAVSLIMVDLDHFKTVNDTWGHEAGDIVLRAIAETLQEGVRTVDVCARFGGEEIAILLPQTALVGASELADRLRKAVETRPIHALGNEIKVTVSCGVACYPDGVLTKEALFAAADRALYDAKHAGRNCVKSAVPKPIGMVR